MALICIYMYIIYISAMQIFDLNIDTYIYIYKGSNEKQQIKVFASNSLLIDKLN